MGVVKDIADTMQLYTQYGGVRPFGVALLLGGIDEKGPQLFEIDPSSTFYSWKAHAIGRGAPEALKLLRKEWKDRMSEDDAIKLAVKSLKAGEKGLKMNEVELIIINNNGFTKLYGDGSSKVLKKYW